MGVSELKISANRQKLNRTDIFQQASVDTCEHETEKSTQIRLIETYTRQIVICDINPDGKPL